MSTSEGTNLAGQALLEHPWAGLVVDDDVGVRQSLRLCLEAAGGRILGVGSSQAALEALDRGVFDVVLLDVWLGAKSGLEVLPEMMRRQPELGVIVVTAFATFEVAVEAMKRGAADFLPKPFTPDQVRLAVQRVLDRRALRRRVVELEQQLQSSVADAWFDSESPLFRAFLQLVRRAALSESVVLLRGESGTGKNVLARWMHDNGPRKGRPFVSVHCPALSSDLMSSALFGHRKGAFTGAIADALGKVEEAAGGTLFLDEIGDLSADAQARLLRFLNDQTYERLGEARERRADVRFLAATNRPIEEDVRTGRFREDLWFRLNVVTLTVPSLRDRLEDLLALAQHYLAFYARKQRRVDLCLSAPAERALLQHRWPGNLRELRNAVERATILAPEPVLTAADLGIPNEEGGTTRIGIQVGALITLDELEREHIARVITRVPTLDAAARALGIDATTLQRKRKRYGLS